MKETVVNQALNPVPAAERVFAWHDHAALWFSLGVGLLVIQVGAYLVPAVGIREVIFATLAGSVIGAGLLAWVSKIACDSGLSSAALMHRSYGRGFARLPVLLNIVQLIGWTSFELLIMREGTLAIAAQALGISAQSLIASIVVALFWGLLLAALLCASMQTLVRRFVSRFGMPLVTISLLWLTYQFASRLADSGFAAFWNRAGDGSLGLFGALDLVIAMPISWLPLVADYARHGRSGRSALGGVWLGYAIANIWCYALGVILGRQAFGAVACPASARLIEPVPALLWLLGIACYHGLPLLDLGLGSALPTLVVTFAMSFITRPKQ